MVSQSISTYLTFADPAELPLFVSSSFPLSLVAWLLD